MAKVKEGAEKAKEELENAKREIEKRAGALDGVAGTNGRKDSSGTKESLVRGLTYIRRRPSPFLFVE